MSKARKDTKGKAAVASAKPYGDKVYAKCGELTSEDKKAVSRLIMREGGARPVSDNRIIDWVLYTRRKARELEKRKDDRQAAIFAYYDKMKAEALRKEELYPWKIAPSLAELPKSPSARKEIAALLLRLRDDEVLYLEDSQDDDLTEEDTQDNHVNEYAKRE